MKKQISLGILLMTLSLWCSIASAQNEKRYNIEMSFVHNGKTVKTALASASYNLNRDTYETDTLDQQKKYIYYSATPVKLDKDLLIAIKDKRATYDILVTMTDTYGKEAKKETLLKKARISNVAESYSPFNYDYAGSISLGINAEAIVIDGVELLP